MKIEELNEILNDIYKIDPSLKDYNEQLKKIIFEIYYERPNVDLDANFKETLKKELLIKINQIKKEAAFKKVEKNPGLVKNLKKINYILFGSLSTVAVIIVAIYYVTTNNTMDNKNLSKNIESVDFSLNIKNSNNNFGNFSIASIQNSANNTGEALQKNANGIAQDDSLEQRAITTNTAAPIVSPGSGKTMVSYDSKMISPDYVPTVYKYVYAGSKDFVSNITDSLQVLKRIKGSSVNFDNSGVFKTNILDLSKFNNLNIDNITISEDKDLGYSLYLAISDGQLSINKNWQKWPQVAYSTENNITDENGILSSDDIIKISNAFINKYNISLENYSSPVIQTDYRILYAKTTDKSNFYVPQYSTVIYPLKINNMEVYELYGEKYGISLSVDTKSKIVDSLYNLETQNYESAKYDLEKDADKIIKIAEDTDNYYQNDSNIKIVNINIKDPVIVYAKIFKYENNKNDEYLVPAVSFSVDDTENANIYGRKNIIVPLTQDLIKESLDRIEQLKNNVVIPRTEPGLGYGSNGSSEVSQPATITLPAKAF